MVSLKKYPSTSKQWQLQERRLQKNKLKKKKDRKENHPHTASLKGGRGELLVGKALKRCFVPKAILKWRRGMIEKVSEQGRS